MLSPRDIDMIDDARQANETVTMKGNKDFLG